MTRKEIEELIEARELLGLSIVAMAAERASQEQIDRLRSQVDRLQEAVSDPEAFPEADVEFHLALATAAGNRFLLSAISDLRALLRRDMELSAAAGIRRFGSLQYSVDAHRELVDAIEAGDPETARRVLFEIMSRHHEFVIGLYAFAPPAPEDATRPAPTRPDERRAPAMEVAPGIHRIESVLGPRPFSQYLLRDERSLLVDTGVKETPAEVILPFLDGLQPDLVLNSHADVDHYGGNAAIKAAAPGALFLAHELDVPWIESAEAIMRERYGWYAAHDLAYEPDVFEWLRDAIGPDTPIDVHLTGGERIRLGPRLTVEVLHLPGHTPGHLGLWDPASRTAIVIDAVMGRGLLDMEGTVIHPPPYFDVDGYLGAARAPAGAAAGAPPDRPLRRDGGRAEVDRFLADTLAFVEDAARARRDGARRESGTLIAGRARSRASTRSSGRSRRWPNELAGTLRAHLHPRARRPRERGRRPALRWTTINEKGGT